MTQQVHTDMSLALRSYDIALPIVAYMAGYMCVYETSIYVPADK